MIAWIIFLIVENYRQATISTIIPLTVDILNALSPKKTTDKDSV